ncbi:hypothetical protein [Arthrobacter bambusae]|uniref:hypothetical protein n=1 Tax=Arthrobacter bambusae TaxID=1338426 RepID=UPI00278A9D31|nr:hypothetical protein [Arthrobacter bambusae]MDQ0032023.1 hypothetical protein [Arthrobacter bambusae]MDQ0100163.1 hypothetical protein [Arthrobacter bambusae]
MNPVATPGGQRLRWSDIAGERLPVDAATQWSDIIIAANPDPSTYYEPETGTIDAGVAAKLFAILTSFARAQMKCAFLIWEGYGSLRRDIRLAPAISNAQGRIMHVHEALLGRAVESIEEPPDRLPMNWLPTDGSWCVANDIFARSVFVGGPAAVIGRILGSPGLEAYYVRPNHMVVPED